MITNNVLNIAEVRCATMFLANPILSVQRLFFTRQRGMSSNVNAMEVRIISLLFLMDLSLSAVVP